MMAALELSDLLESEGAEVVGPVSTLAAAMARTDLHEIDAAVLDITLKDGEVFPFAQRLRETQTPFLFATAYGSSGHLPASLSDIEVIPKPYPQRRLIRNLKQII